MYFESSPKQFCPFTVLFVSSIVAATTNAISARKAWMYKLDIALDDNVACSHDIEHWPMPKKAIWIVNDEIGFSCYFYI